jgi:hypothetical protein
MCVEILYDKVVCVNRGDSVERYGGEWEIKSRWAIPLGAPPMSVLQKLLKKVLREASG